MEQYRSIIENEAKADVGTNLKMVMGLFLRRDRIKNRLEEYGIEINFVKHLDKMTNVETVWGGHLKNATCHYVNRWEVKGKTYPIKQFLRSEGFYWDHEKKVWWTENIIDNMELGAKIIRYNKTEPN
jgi:hypothetical protein